MDDQTRSALSATEESSPKTPEDQEGSGDELQQQRPGAVEAFIREHQDRVVNTCYGFLHNRPDAEDAAQQVFIKAWQALPEFRGESRLSTWLYRIAVRTSLDILRQRRREQHWGRFLSFFGWEKVPSTVVGKDPLVEIEQRERARLLMKAIDELPEQQRIAYTLASFERLKGQEIAEVMETSVAAVESLLHRAKANLRQHLQSLADPETNSTKARDKEV